MAQAIDLKRRVERTIEQVARQLKLDLFDGIIVSVVKEWLDCSDSVAELNEAIHRRLQQVWPATERKIEAAFADLEEALKTNIEKLPRTGTAGQLDAAVVGRGVSAPIANVIGAVTTLIGGTLLGGAETALLLEGVR